MDYITNIDWSLLWTITVNIIIPNLGKLLFSTILFSVIGLVLSIIYSIILYKKGVLKRKPKYYNWLVKLYLPLLLGAFLFVFGQIGIVRGTYTILENQKELIVEIIYAKTLSFAFESELSKKEFFEEIQFSATEVKDESGYLIDQFKDYSESRNTGYSLIDNGKDQISSLLIEKYGRDIYKVMLYGILNVAASKADVHITESISYSTFSYAIDVLQSIGYKDFELAIKEELIRWFDTILKTQYQSIMTSLLLLLLLFMCIPLIEFFIYKKWIEPYLLRKEVKNQPIL